MTTDMILLLSISKPKLEEKPYTATHGLFSAVTPDERSKKTLMNLAKRLGFESKEDSLHCTVMYSLTAPQSDIEEELNSEKVHRAFITYIEHIMGHDDKGYVICNLECLSLQKEHDRLVRAGAEPTFTPYKPHITLYAGVPLTDELRDKIHKVNKGLPKIYVTLSNQFVGDLK